MMSRIVSACAALGLLLLIAMGSAQERKDEPTPKRLGAGDHTRTIKVGDVERRYTVHIPKGYDDKNGVPVIVVFHGGGGNPSSMARLAGMNVKSEEAGFIVVYPYGSGLDPDRGLTFNGGGCCGYAMQKKIDDVGFTRAVLDDLAKVANVDTNRVFATGLSNGGIMAHYVASELSDRIAAIAPVGGPLMMETPRNKRPVSVMHFHGTADEFAPFKGGFGKGFLGRNGITKFRSVDHTIQTWVKENRCTNEPEITALPDKADDGMKCTRKTWSGCRDGSEVVLIEIENGGHTWPGNEPTVAMLGKSTKDISANDLMWEFFQKHPMKSVAAPMPASDIAPGKLKELPDSDATRDAAGTGQMFEAIHVPGLTDFREGLNGFALGDFDKNGYLDILTVTTEPFALDATWGDETGGVKRTRNPKDKLRLLLNFGGFRLKSQAVTLTGSAATPDDLSQGWRGGQVPALADFNGDGFLDIFITRQAPMSNGKIREGSKPIGCSLFLSDGGFDRFRDVSVEYGALNELAYNRQVSLGDVNRDGFIDIALGADNVVNAFEGLPKSALFVFQPKDGKFVGGKFADISGTDLIPDFGGFYHDSAKDKAGPNLALRDIDNDGDLDLIQSTHVLLVFSQPPTLPYSPAEYRHGIFNWQNLLAETGRLQFEKVTGNGFASEARLRYNREAERLVPMTESRAPGLPYLVFGDVNNDGLLDALAVGGGDPFNRPATEDVGARFWYNRGGFRFEEATAKSGLGPLNQSYREWFAFLDAAPSAAVKTFNPAARKIRSQPGLTPKNPLDNRPSYSDAVFGDFNNDGWLDVVAFDRLESQAIETRSFLFLNRGDGTFEPQPTTISGLNGTGICGAATDLNNDGLLDLIVAADPDNTGKASDPRRYESMVFMNAGLHGARENHWLRLRFSGITHARLLGARIDVFEPGTKKRLGTRGIYSNQSYKSGSSLEAHFGLGKARRVDVSVHLLGGENFTVKNVQGDRYLDLNVAERDVREVAVIKVENGADTKNSIKR
ncbi:MAG: VCBS repeat-containing protein [Chloracidobacterium sp.]|nr:VCBS repeat-containing protein [Chloracidobacterium sp.]